MITFNQVSKRLRERLVLDSVSWRMDEGECVVFVGHSGAGKTLILRMITHEILPTSGTISIGTFRGGRLSRSQRALLRRTLGIIYEDFRLLNDRTVFENVALAVRITGMFRNEEVIPRVLYALEEVGLQDKQSSYPLELSAGEKQRAAIARAIVNRPAVVLADEPTGALEQKSSDEILALLRRIHDEGAALLLVTTRDDIAATLRSRTIKLDAGRIVGGEAFPPPNLESMPEPAGA
jgi:cell division transport system ATP-binding protein